MGAAAHLAPADAPILVDKRTMEAASAGAGGGSEWGAMSEGQWVRGSEREAVRGVTKCKCKQTCSNSSQAIHTKIHTKILMETPSVSKFVARVG